MMRNEKAEALTSNGLNNGLTNQLTMSNSTRNQSEFQFDSAIPPKVFQTINCFNCHNERELDGYIFRLVAVCADCRTESEVLITRKRFERRRASR